MGRIIKLPRTGKRFSSMTSEQEEAFLTHSAPQWVYRAPHRVIISPGYLWGWTVHCRQCETSWGFVTGVTAGNRDSEDS